MTLYWLAMANILYERVMQGKSFKDLSHEEKLKWVRIAQEAKKQFEK